MQLFPGISFAQARTLVFATFTGSWEEAHKDVLVPAFRKANNNADIALDPMLSVDQIAKVSAARANPPIDVMLHDPGPALIADRPGPRRAVPGGQEQALQGPDPRGAGPDWARRSFFQVVGLTYNPEKIKTPPTSWADLWKPEYKGRVGITNLNSTLGTGLLVEIARMSGGSRGQRRTGLQGDRGAEAQPRRGGRQSRRAGDAVTSRARSTSARATSTPSRS